MTKHKELQPQPERGEYVQQVHIRSESNSDRVTVQVKQERVKD